tara:strand:- start:1490 stop:1873 length:384 start_codon:yes stop_codon:yes gene_type:complete
MKSRIGFILLVSSVLLPRFGFSEGSGKGSDMKASYKPKPGEKWAVIEIRDIKKKMKYEAVPEVLAKDRRAEIFKIYELSYNAWKQNGGGSLKPLKPRVKIYKQGLTKGKASQVEFERNQRMRKYGKQ